jgi:RNA polymerase sigma factor (sigma-70 family)
MFVARNMHLPAPRGSTPERAQDMTSEEVLAGESSLGAVQERESLSVHEVIRRHHDSLMRFLRHRLRVRADAADVAQEAYIRMMQYEGSRDIQSPSSMLFRIAINVANDLGRSEQGRRVRQQTSIEGLELDCGTPSVEREIAAQQDLALLYEAIDDLPPRCQHVFLLSRVNHMTYPQIAAHCGISVKMVDKHIGHALAACMKKVGGC